MRRLNPPCSFLPLPTDGMSYRDLRDLRGRDAAAFYLIALRYANHLWQCGHSGRAILALTRALYADVPFRAPVLEEWPLPYRALHWIVRHHPSGDFPGNPRISFQHQATRLRGERQELRRARAWAAWAIVCRANPGLPGDVAQGIIEPDTHAIRANLNRYAHPDEADLWLEAMLGAD